MNLGLKFVFAALIASASLDLATAQFKENCADGKDSQCGSGKPFCCSLTNVADANKKMKMCMSKNQISDDKIVGEVKDEDDDSGQNIWKYVCPTMINRCDKVTDCAKEGQEENGFCCSTTIKYPEGHKDKVNTCVPKYKEIPKGAPQNDGNDLSKKPIGEFEKLVTYKTQKDSQSRDTVAGDLTYEYACPSMLGDCEVFKKKDGKYVLDNNFKTFEDDYACGKDSLTAKKHCCSMQAKDPALGGTFKMCMQHDAGTSPFGKFEHKDGDKAIKFDYICPSLVANCTTDDKCSSTSKQPHCCQMEAKNPGIKGKTNMCMASTGNITGKLTMKQNEKEGKNKIEFTYRCPAEVLQNCTGDPERDCNYRQPYCCKLKNKDYKWKEGAGTSDFQMCMDTPRRGKKLMKDKWTDPTGAATFSYDCPETTFDPAASAFDDFFDYAIDFKHGKNKKLTKAGLKYDQCQKNADCPAVIKNMTTCCVASVMSLGDWDKEGNLVNITNSTVKRCMKEQIPDSQIFTEIDDYQVSMNCTESTQAARVTLALLLSLATVFATYLF